MSPGVRGLRTFAKMATCASVALSVALPAAAEGQRNVYVAVSGSGEIAGFDTSASGGLTPLSGSPFAGAPASYGVTITPDGKRLYVANTSGTSISAFDVAADGNLSPLPGSPFSSSAPTYGGAVSPDGSLYFVANYDSDEVSVYSVGSGGALSQVPGSPFAAGEGPIGLAVSPDGKFLYVTNNDFLNNVTPSNISAYAIGAGGALSPLGGSPFAAGLNPGAIGVDPDGRFLYVANFRSDNVAVYAIAPSGGLSQVPGSPFATGGQPYGVAAGPDGTRLFVTNSFTNNVSAFAVAADGALTAVAGSPFAAGDQPIGIGVAPGGDHLYVANYGVGPPGPGPYVDASVSAYGVAPSGALSSVAGSPFATGGEAARFQGLAISPNQPPVAALTVGTAEVGSPVSFDAASSIDPDGAIATYDWDFGDGTKLPDGGPAPSHTYATAGHYEVTVTLTDDEGCSMRIVYTGQSATCNGSAVARASAGVQVADPPDSPAPKTSIKGKPKYQQRKDTRFRFESSISGSTFKCKLDGSRYKDCQSPKNYKNLKPGKHRFLVYAVSPDGIADASPAKVKFKVKGRKKG